MTSGRQGGGLHFLVGEAAMLLVEPETVEAAGKRVFDEAGWESAIQSVLAACKEFNVACGYPAGLGDIELRMKQGFSVFVIGWGENGFKTVELGRRVAGRPAL